MSQRSTVPGGPAQSLPISTAPSGVRSKLPPKVPWKSLLLVSLLVFLVSILFYSHFYFLFVPSHSTELFYSTFVAGATLIAWLISNTIPTGIAQKEWRNILRRLECWRYGYHFLIGANGIMALLLIASASIYVDLQKPSSGISEEQIISKAKVELLRHGRPRWTAELSQSKPRFFHFYLKFFNEQIALRVLEPNIYAIDSREEGISKSIRFEVPPTVGLKEFYALRIVPGIGLDPDLPPPPPEFQDSSRFSLTVYNEKRKSPYLISDLRRQMIYLGPPESDLKFLLPHDPNHQMSLCPYIEQYLTEEKCERHPLWDNPPRFAAMDITKGDQLTFSIKYSSGDGKTTWQRVIKKNYIVDHAGVSTCILENI
jgi:hypothetical protein